MATTKNNFDWNGEAKKARSYTVSQLHYAIHDALDTIQVQENCGMDASKYYDQISVYRKELKRRLHNRNARIKNQVLRDLCGTSARAAKEDMGL